MRGYTQNKHEHLERLLRVESQIRGLQQMIDSDQYRIDVLAQVAATTGALRAVALGLLDEHLHHCIGQAIATGGADADATVRDATVRDASRAVARLIRS